MEYEHVMAICYSKYLVGERAINIFAMLSKCKNFFLCYAVAECIHLYKIKMKQ